MNGELENLKNQLKEVQSKLDALKGEKAKLDELKKDGNFSDNLQEYYDSISKAILASESIIAKIKEKIHAIESQKENSSYRLTKDMIPYSTLKYYEAIDKYRQIDTTEQAKPKDPEDKGVIIDIDPIPYDETETEEDYIGKDRKKRIAESALIAALLIAIGAASIKLFDAVKDKQSNKENTATYEPVATDNSDNFYNYEENTVTITPEPTTTPVPTPSNPFINVFGYNETYLKDYESTKEIYNTTAEDAVEYVNDAYKILETRFYGEEATLDDIINVLVAIRTGNLYTEDNVSILRPIDSVLNLITENYIFGVPTEEDITKLSALQYFAKEGTDLDKFLTRYYQLLVDVLRNPYDGIYKDNLYNFLNVYASNLNNGFVNEPELTTGNEEIDNDAKLNSYYDFQLAYDGFVFDTLPLLQSGVNDPNAGSQEDIDRSNRSLELQDLLYTAVHDLMQDCEPSLTRGGE